MPETPDVPVPAAPAHGGCGAHHHAPIALAQWRASARRFRFLSFEIPFHDDGAGPVLLLVHGFPTASWDWTPVWHDLAHRFRVIAPDLLGFGDAPKEPGAGYTIARQADLLEALLEHLGVARCHVLAHDYGDTVVQELLARHDDVVATGATPRPVLDSVCFLNGGLFPETHEPRPVQKLLAGPFGPLVGRLMSRRAFERSMKAIFGPITQPTEDELATFWELVTARRGTRIVHELIGYMAERRTHRERWVGALQRTRVPLRVIDGVEDPVSGGHMVDRYEQLVPDPDVVRLEGVGHYPQVEDPEAVLDAFHAFHDRLGTRAD